jgi:hypothetical protein
MDKLMHVDVVGDSGKAGVSAEFAVECSESGESHEEPRCERLFRLDSDLEKVRGDIGVRGEPEVASLIETTGGD